MKKQYLLISLLFSLQFLFSQTIDVGRTAGQLDVSLTGAATYNVPISVPPGIKDVVPQIGLSFSSQAGNGVAGWGWNVSGLSAITRIPATTYHDGFIDPVDFDLEDRYALDGQRLLLVSGTYGAPNSVYQTENFSNIKIKAFGTHPSGSNYGPKYFKVFYPNGNIAIYGSGTNGTGRMSWAITKWKDPQNNNIVYSYVLNNNTQYIHKIFYGNKEGQSQPNLIQINYRPDRIRQEQMYVGGISFKTKWILNNIEVRSYSQLLRKYKLSYEATSLGYEKLTEIQEFNGVGHAFEPIVFTYAPETSEGMTPSYQSHNLPNDISSEDGDRVISGDFDGDGHMDFITYNISHKDHFHHFNKLFSSGGDNGWTTTVGSFTDIFTGSVLDSNEKMQNKQSLVIVKDDLQNGIRTIIFEIYTYNSNSHFFELDYTKVWNNAPIYTDEFCSGNFTQKIPLKYVLGDFNGDGLTQIIALEKYYSYSTNCEWIDDEKIPCECDETDVYSKKTYLIDLNQWSTTEITSSGNLDVSFSLHDMLNVGDFNGDGKADLFHFTTSHYVHIYSLDEQNNIERIYVQQDSKIMNYSSTHQKRLPIYLGDYNGDGKTDFLIPTSAAPALNDIWKFFMSDGEGIQKEEKLIPLLYFDFTKVDYINDKGHNYLVEKYFTPFDYNGDGKTDIIKHEIVHKFDEDDEPTIDAWQQRIIFKNMSDNTSDFPTLSKEQWTTTGNDIPSAYGIPIFLPHGQVTGNLEYCFIDQDRIDKYICPKDNKKDMVLDEVENNGIVNAIHYGTLESGNYYYEPDYSQSYPYFNINLAPTFKLVTKIDENIGNLSRYKLFKYEGAITHIGGQGFLGFKILKRSSLAADGLYKTWSISQHNPQNRGAVINQWTAKNHSNYETFYISKTHYQYETTGGNGQVYVKFHKVVVLFSTCLCFQS